jgi:HK97 family phage prohead protease
MPYGISQNQAGCNGWATVMQTEDGYETIGCHASKQEAIDQMVAVSIAEDMEPLGEVDARQIYVEELEMPEAEDESEDSIEVDAEDVLDVMSETGLTPRDAALYEAYEQIAEKFGMWSQDDAHYMAESPFAENGIKCLNCPLFVGGGACEIVEGKISPNGVCKLWVIRKDLLTGDSEPREIPEIVEVRAVDLSAPKFMRDNARRGLEYHEQGLSGDGLKPQTVEDAREMAAGRITEAKWRKIAPWIARHMVDLEAEGAADGEITAGIVAHLLWGSGTTKSEATRAMNYAERIVSQLDEERTVTETIENRTANWVVRDESESRRIAFSNMEVRASDDGTKLVGYAAVFDSPSEPLPWIEYVKRGAFTKTLNDGADVRLLIDHEGVPLARTKSGTLSLREDDRGLFVESDLDPMNPDAARLISALRRGDISQMSFAFRTIKDSWSEDRSMRELREVQLFDVSVVTFPAYEATVAELRANSPAATIQSPNTLGLRKRQIQIARTK